MIIETEYFDALKKVLGFLTQNGYKARTVMVNKINHDLRDLMDAQKISFQRTRSPKQIIRPVNQALLNSRNSRFKYFQEKYGGKI